jgi:hypothetical protein
MISSPFTRFFSRSRAMVSRPQGPAWTKRSVYFPPSSMSNRTFCRFTTHDPTWFVSMGTLPTRNPQVAERAVTSPFLSFPRAPSGLIRFRPGFSVTLSTIAPFDETH